jgi:uncharacterized membrane protein YedE/YeeE
MEPGLSITEQEVTVEKNNYWSPYLAGVGIGLVLLSVFYFMGMGVGASSAFARAAADTVQRVDPAHAKKLSYFSAYLKEGSPLKDWIVFEVAGMFIGALIASISSRSFNFKFDRGKNMNAFVRVFTALIGGGLIGFSSRLARGCTSGVGLTGSAQLAVGGWVFLIAMFLLGFLTAFILRKEMWQ